MEIEKEVLDNILNSNNDFKRLYAEHSELKLKIDDMNKTKFLTTEEELEKKRHQSGAGAIALIDPDTKRVI